MLDSGLVNRGSRIILPSDGSRTTLDDPPRPKQKWVLTPESFDRMLTWLASDRDRAGERYEEIRSRLIKRFRQLGCADPEQLTNETFDRVARKLPEIIDTWDGDPEPFFFAVAYYVYLEHLRKPGLVPFPENLPDTSSVSTFDPDDDDEIVDSCLSHCLLMLSESKREMILQYYHFERDVKIRMRKAMADRMGIKLTNLRLKAQRVRNELKKCIVDCVQRNCAELDLVDERLPGSPTFRKREQ